MDLYAGSEVLAPLEEALRGVEGPRALEPLTALCWHLRQRDTRRALELGARGQALLDSAGTADGHRARLALARAEGAHLMGRSDEAQALARLDKGAEAVRVAVEMARHKAGLK